VVVTDKRDWGGWRTPGAEYDRDPAKFERQARLIACAPKLLKLAIELQDFVAEAPDEAPTELVDMARQAMALIKHISELPGGPAEKSDQASVMAAE
jgi:hypothetical protein